ncbi:hypothetical protein QUB68_05290 [Microcoleus sp. A006_D1]|uniref:hypothetical protein n=1 Tax=Microcoleus sp. A006_D1 TaxID=3055267 RepID=UPI002FCFD612
MVLFYNGMVVKILFLPPFHYKVNITLISDKSKEAPKKKSIFFEIRFIAEIEKYLEIICLRSALDLLWLSWNQKIRQEVYINRFFECRKSDKLPERIGLKPQA